MTNNKQILEGSHAVAETIKAIAPAVVSAYPITPQTHIVEDLAQMKAAGEANFEFVRAESEFAAASIVAGAAATGVRVYTSTSSQGLLLMTEVIFNIAGMRLPVVMTCANRGVSAPITIWNDHQDVMTIRDAGWILLFAENHQEAVEQHLLAYKIAEKMKLPVMVNIDGFVLTHTYESVVVPTREQVLKYLPDYIPEQGTYLDPANPITLGAFATPAHYFEIREGLHNDLLACKKILNDEYTKLKKAIPEIIKKPEADAIANNGLLEYYGTRNPQTILIALGSLVGTIKDVVDEINGKNNKLGPSENSIGVLKIKAFRPFPADEVVQIIANAKYVAVVEKAVSLGASDGPLAAEIKAAANGKIKTDIKGFVVGLGGRDITREMIKKIIKDVGSKDNKMKFVGR